MVLNCPQLVLLVPKGTNCETDASALMRLAFFAFKMASFLKRKSPESIEITSIQQLRLFVNVFPNMLYHVGII